jgi:hypothetical protein
LDISGLLRTFAADIPGAARAYDRTSKVPREISSMLKAVLAQANDGVAEKMNPDTAGRPVLIKGWTAVSFTL